MVLGDIRPCVTLVQGDMIIAFGPRSFFMEGTKIVKDLHSEDMSGVILRGVPKYNRLTHRGYFKD